MKKIVTIVGARPQFVKAAIVSRMIRKAPLKEILVHTGQHYDDNMSKIFFDELEMPKIDYQLGVGSDHQGKQTADMLTAIESVLMKEKPDYLLIYGDTNSTLAGALAAAKLHIPIAHVEAGLRSYNRKMPEEINRIVADQLASILYTPTRQASLNLQQEGFSENRIYEVGDVMYDAALFYGEKALQHSHIMQKLALKKKEFILATVHRAENTNDPKKLHTIFRALTSIAQQHTIIMPLHPRTRKMINDLDPTILQATKIHIIEPIGFLDMVMLEKHAALIITDSGGVQKEAFFYQVPCLTLRTETEWVETVELKWNKLVDPIDANFIIKEAEKSLEQCDVTQQFPYGKGNATELIVTHLTGAPACAYG